MGAPPTAGWRKSLTRWRRRVEVAVLSILAPYVLLAYFVLPAAWRHYEHHPALQDAPKVTLTSDGIPGDPLNIGLIGTKEELIRAMTDAGWRPADARTWRTSVMIVGSVLLSRSYPTAPVSDLMVFGRKQDLAFELPVGTSAKQRHHVRFWKVENLETGNRPLWIGAVTFDKGVGLSHNTGSVTHHISPDVDAERDKIIDDLRRVAALRKIYQVTGVGATLQGRNGGGDWYYSDGELSVGVLTPAGKPAVGAVVLPNPTVVWMKDQAWSALKQILPDEKGQEGEKTPG